MHLLLLGALPHMIYQLYRLTCRRHRLNPPPIQDVAHMQTHTGDVTSCLGNIPPTLFLTHPKASNQQAINR